MLIARKLFDNFLDATDAQKKEFVYELAIYDLDEATALMANLYESIFGDYPTGLVATFMQQHLKDKVFQKTVQANQAMAA
jgi:hypothetical protein